MNDAVEKAIDLITKLYQYPGCETGGYAHIVTDDWNLEDEDIDFCIKEAEKGGHDIDEAGRQLCLSVLNELKSLSASARYSALGLAKLKSQSDHQCSYEQYSNKPCASCPKKITTLYKCNLLKEARSGLYPHGYED